jgi:hypothetical protein
MQQKNTPTDQSSERPMGVKKDSSVGSLRTRVRAKTGNLSLSKK